MQRYGTLAGVDVLERHGHEPAHQKTGNGKGRHTALPVASGGNHTRPRGLYASVFWQRRNDRGRHKDRHGAGVRQERNSAPHH